MLKRNWTEVFAAIVFTALCVVCLVLAYKAHLASLSSIISDNAQFHLRAERWNYSFIGFINFTCAIFNITYLICDIEKK